MASTRENMSMDTELAFKEFSKNISYCIFNRILGIISWLLIIASNICLLLCYCLLTGSKYLEYMMIDICTDMDLIYFQVVANHTIQSVSDTVNDWLGSRDSVSKTNIKREFTSILERYLSPEWVTELATEDMCDNHPVNEDDVEIKTEPIVLNDDSSDEELTNINNNLEEQFDNEVDDVKLSTESIVIYEDSSDDEKNNDSNSEELTNINSNININLEEHFDDEVEDVTEQTMAERVRERERDKIVLDLTGDDES